MRHKTGGTPTNTATLVPCARRPDRRSGIELRHGCGWNRITWKPAARLVTSGALATTEALQGTLSATLYTPDGAFALLGAIEDSIGGSSPQRHPEGCRPIGSGTHGSDRGHDLTGAAETRIQIFARLLKLFPRRTSSRSGSRSWQVLEGRRPCRLGGHRRGRAHRAQCARSGRYVGRVGCTRGRRRQGSTWWPA